MLSLDIEALRKSESQNVTFLTQTSLTNQEVKDVKFISEHLDMETDIRQHNMLTRLKEI